jgi:hypothetical protein
MKACHRVDAGTSEDSDLAGQVIPGNIRRENDRYDKLHQVALDQSRETSLSTTSQIIISFASMTDTCLPEIQSNQQFIRTRCLSWCNEQ